MWIARFCVALAWTGLAVAAPVDSLRQVELRTAGQSAQLTLTVSGEGRHKLFTLDNPHRLVIDLPATRPVAGLKLPPPAGPVQSLRSGQQPGQTTRIVLQLPARLPSQDHWVALPGKQSRLVVSLGEPLAAAQPDPAPRTAPRRAPPPAGREIVVAIDPGHGGQDPGATGKAGLQEKDVTLAIARALAERINQTPGLRAVLTRNSDRFVVLRDRIDFARAARADLFVSIHADSIANPEVAGSSVYVLSERGASSEAARWLAERENAADLKGGVSLGDKQGELAKVLLDLSQTASIGSSMEAAERVLGWLDRVGEVRKSRVQQAGFVVLKSPDIPSMLVETAYISNPQQEKQLRSADYQEQIAVAIHGGLIDYFRANPPDGSLFAAQKEPAAPQRMP